MRIIAGQYKGHRLAEPKSSQIRPTSDRARETLFNILQHGLGFVFEGRRVIDVFAGSGALGLEAMSRGAQFCLFIDHKAEARGLIRTNIEALGLTGATRIYRRDVANLSKTGTMGCFDLAFLDPPYDQGLGSLAFNALHQGGWLVPGAVCALEERKSAQIDLPCQFELLDQRSLADTQLILCRYDPV